MTQAELASFAAAWNASPVLGYLGIVMSFTETTCIVDLPVVRPEQRGGKGSDAINGGVLAALFDFAIGGTAMLAPPLRRNATAQMSMSFERAVRGDRARCIAKIDRVTKHLVFAIAELHDARGELCARATGLVSLSEPVSLAEWSAAI